jgi:hypothetical protein
MHAHHLQAWIGNQRRRWRKNRLPQPPGYLLV